MQVTIEVGKSAGWGCPVEIEFTYLQSSTREERHIGNRNEIVSKQRVRGCWRERKRVYKVKMDNLP